MADTDIITLQELDHYRDWFEPHLQRAGYEGVFRCDPYSPCLKTNTPPDGVAIFYRRDRFSLEDQLLGPVATDEKQEKSKSIFLRLKLLSGDTDTPHLIVATTHLHAKKTPTGVKKRTFQAQQLLLRLGDFVRGKSQTSPPAVILAGDFNAPPAEELFEIIRSHPLKLRGGYDGYLSGLEALSSWKPFTSWKIREGGFKAGESKYWIDYIFHSPALRPLAVMKTPNETEIGIGGLPCAAWPSDHLSLATTYQLLSNDTRDSATLEADSSTSPRKEKL